MKISELSTDKAFEVLCDLTPYLCSITADEKLIATLKQKTKLEAGASRAEFLAVGVAKISALAPLILKDHKDDIIGILAVIFEKDPEEIKAQNITETVAMLREVLQDKDLLNFFKSFS